MTLLSLTEDAFLLHMRRAALATLIDKTAHVSKPAIPPYEEYGWVLDNGTPVPVVSTHSACPQQMTKTVSCGCTKGCNRNCSCAKNNIPCYISCRCQGSSKKCGRTMIAVRFGSSENSESENDT